MLITKDDVGRKVRQRNGVEGIITGFNYFASYPVEVAELGQRTVAGLGPYTVEGHYYGPNDSSDYDIVEFVDGHSTVELPEREISQHTCFQDIIDDMDVEYGDNGQFIQKVPSAESNAKRFLKMLEAQGIYELVIVTDIGELRCEIYKDKKGES